MRRRIFRWDSSFDGSASRKRQRQSLPARSNSIPTSYLRRTHRKHFRFDAAKRCLTVRDALCNVAPATLTVSKQSLLSGMEEGRMRRFQFVHCLLAVALVGAIV